MILLIDGKQAALPDNFSFDYMEENRLFTDADGYTLDIDLPLKGCAENRAIFGYIERNPPTRKRQWTALLSCSGFSRKGVVVLTDITATGIKVQFLEGRSAANVSTAFKEKYIDTLPIGTKSVTLTEDSPTEFACRNYVAGVIPSATNMQAVALPWYNMATDTMQNMRDGDGWAQITLGAQSLSWMPYLIEIAQRVATCVGYSIDVSEWAASPLVQLIICNAVPVAKPGATAYNFATALPHWTVQEFFDRLEPLLGGEFEIDHTDRSIKFGFTATRQAATSIVRLDNVEDEVGFTSSYGREDTDSKYIAAQRYRYADPGLDLWKYYDCPWAEETGAQRVSYDTLAELLAATPDRDEYDNTESRVVLYCKEFNINFYWDWYINDEEGQHVGYILRPLNPFGPTISDVYADKMEELHCLPVLIHDGKIILDAGDAPDASANVESVIEHDEKIANGEEDEEWVDPFDIPENEELMRFTVADAVRAGESKDESVEYYSELFVGYLSPDRTSLLPHVLPWSYDVNSRNLDTQTAFSMRINSNRPTAWRGLPTIHEAIKYTYRFHSLSLPDVRSIFFIKGDYYLCKKMTAKITSRGMSPRIEGEFYKIKDL